MCPHNVSFHAIDSSEKRVRRGSVSSYVARLQRKYCPLLMCGTKLEYTSVYTRVGGQTHLACCWAGLARLASNYTGIYHPLSLICRLIASDQRRNTGRKLLGFLSEHQALTQVKKRPLSALCRDVSSDKHLPERPQNG